jgi:hypothetical protein
MELTECVLVPFFFVLIQNRDKRTKKEKTCLHILLCLVFNFGLMKLMKLYRYKNANDLQKSLAFYNYLILLEKTLTW